MIYLFSGCGGNKNNFDSIADCESSCHKLVDYIQKDKSKINLI